MENAPPEISPVAARVIEKCGGVARTAKLTGCDVSWIHRWRYPKSRGGTDGHVPASAQRKLLAASKEGLVDLDPADFFEAEDAA